MTTKKLTETDLEKGIAALNAVANQNNVVARRNELIVKANEGTASTEEREELIKSLSGNDLADKATAGLQTDTLQKSIDVSDFLKDMHSGVMQGLEALGGALQKSMVDEQGFRVALATTLAAMHDVQKTQGEILKSLTGAVDAAGNQPARGPLSKGVTGAPAPRAAPLAKSFGGAAGTPVQNGREYAQLSDNQVFDALEGMQKGGKMHVGGEDLMKAVIKYESLRQISPAVMAAVQEFVTKNAS